LRAAADQAVDWFPWGEEAFARARELARPVLLDIGASWCHFCHVMDAECYRDPEIASYLNGNYVAVRVDADERPDLDARYQSAVAQLTGSSGWPLTAFLAPDGTVYFGGTYFSRRPSGGRPGFLQILTWARELYQSSPESRLDDGRRLRESLAARTGWSAGGAADAQGAIDRAASDLVDQVDRRNGGFGEFPKFLNAGGIDLLLRVGARRGNIVARDAALFTLAAMSRGKIRDRARGGFHRYAVDERWENPHFEKLLPNQAEMLAVLARGFAAIDPNDPARRAVRPELEAAARDTARFLLESLEDREGGGFFASTSAEDGAAADRTVVPAWNALAATSLVEASGVFGEEAWRGAARRALDRVLEEFAPRGAVVARPRGAAPLLIDSMAAAEACARLHEATLDPKYLARAEEILMAAAALFWNESTGAFADRDPKHSDPFGAAFLVFPLEDGFHASGNALALRALDRLLLHREIPTFRELANRLASTIAKSVPHFSALALASALAALDRHLAPPSRVVIVGNGGELEGAVPAGEGAVVVRIGGENRENLSEDLRALVAAAGPQPTAFVCRAASCSPPLRTEADLRRALASEA
jgi:uncharacterized protein YyaL (SSP411 family)